MLKVEELTKVYPARHGEYAGGIREASFALEPGSFFTLLGPSGCGKTTTLRCIAGLEEPDSGRITIGDTPIFDGRAGQSVPMHKRNIGMVFQSYAIWPHMTVAENVSFPLRVDRRHGMDRTEIARATDEALSAVGLSGYGARSATQLSGGQQQRVALARAIVHRPKLLLLDEPLSNLDATLREGMRTELKRLQSEMGITAVYVTHDQTEALAMSDMVAVIDKGRIVQMDNPRNIYFRPATEFVAAFIGHTNLLYGRKLGAEGGIATLDLGQGLRLSSLEDGAQIAPERDAVISVRPENIRILPCNAEADAPNRIGGRVAGASFLGSLVHYDIAVGDRLLQVESRADIQFEPGAEVALSFDPRQARLLATGS